MPINRERAYKYTVYLLLLIIIAAMSVHQTMIGDTKIKYDKNGNETQTEEEKTY